RLMLHDLGRYYFRRRYTILFYSLVFTMAASPIVAALGWRGAVIESLLAANLLAAAIPINAGKTRTFLLAAMAAGWLARVLAAWSGHSRLSEIMVAFWTLIGLFAAAAALRFAMRGARVEAEHLSAALSAYLLAGIYFGLLYWDLEQASPGLFNAVNFSR